MEPAFLVFLSFLPFSGTHIGLGLEPVRGRLVERFGERGFVNVFSVVATLTFAVWVATTAAVRSQGLPGLGLTHHPGFRIGAIFLIGLGFVLGAGSLASYARSPMALFSNVVREPRGVERVSRHAFFAGVALFAVGHVLLAPTLAAATFFAALTLHATLGAWAQDRKLLARLGAPYRGYVEQTSAVPFAAVALGRQPFAAREQPWVAYSIGLLLALLLREAHAHLFDYYGAWIIGSVVVGGAVATWSAERAQRRERSLRHA